MLIQGAAGENGSEGGVAPASVTLEIDRAF